MDITIFSNEEIYGYHIILIDENGTNRGEMIKKAAISLAREKGLDLIQVAKNEKGVSICKFGDVGKMKFEASKKKKTVSKPVETKEMMFHLNTGENDVQVKKKKIRNMLEKKCMVKMGVEPERDKRRAFSVDKAREMLKQLVVDFRDVAKWDDLKIEANTVFVVLKPAKESTHAEQVPEASK